MPLKYGKDSNFKAKKGRSGRKTDREIVEHYVNVGLASRIANEELVRISKTKTEERKREDLKEIVMPVALKNISDKVQHSGVVKQIHANDIKNTKEILNLTEEYEKRLLDKILK